ncbi:metallophosphoesterase [Neptuniibacter sp.]|uniref:metallophosphoesterase n=1 Tax=Neptuniibacter sp. TaxID=1962643 RepID=UPI0026269CB2|nr:metallophosphoesterase [Neptuniibacter sp.]MCP4597025.1 hypothetical protein [Neptuniibacter sp.]
MKKHLLFGDVHGEYSAKDVLNIIHAFSQDWQPDRVWAMGDIGNFDWASKYNDRHEFTAREEYAFIDELFESLGVTDFYFGNHEERLERDDIPSDYRELFKIGEHVNLKNVNTYPYSIECIPKIGRVSVTHGFNWNKHVACTASEDFGRVIVWHAHRYQVYTHWKTGMKQAAYSIPCCCRLVMPFEKKLRPRGHSHGFCILYEHSDGIVDVRPIPIIGDSVVIEGRVYKRKS